jgi:hypothetical protein
LLCAVACWFAAEAAAKHRRQGHKPAPALGFEKGWHHPVSGESKQQYITFRPTKLEAVISLSKVGFAPAGTGFDSGLVDMAFSDSPNILHRWDIEKFYAPVVMGFTDTNILGPPTSQAMIFELLLNSQLVYASRLDETLFPQPSAYATKEERELETQPFRFAQTILSADLFSPIPIISVPRLQARIRGTIASGMGTGGIGGSYHPFLDIGYQLNSEGNPEPASQLPTLSISVEDRNR